MSGAPFFLVPPTADQESSGDAPGCPVFSTKLRTIFNETDLSLTTSFVNRFTFSGSGKLVGFVYRFNNMAPVVKLTIDSEIIFDLEAQQLFDIEVGSPLASGPNGQPTAGGPSWDNTNRTFVYMPLCPIVFFADVKIDVKKIGAPSVTLTRDLITLTKET